jgi:hypothetical protein
MTEKKEEGNKITYVCHCGNKFERYVTKGTQVYCLKCLNFIPTYKTERTGNLIGKKHVHMFNKTKVIYGEK